VGVLAKNISLEVIPICLFVLFAALLGAHLIASRRPEAAAAPEEHLAPVEL